jgi:sirohydrochlorin ferrochelatase
MRSLIWLFADGRPGRFGYRHVRVTKRRCQASNVAGVTSRYICSRRGSSRANAQSTARSGHEGRGRPTCRRKTATSCRNVSSSTMTADSLRARTASHRNRHTMIYRRRRHTVAEPA